MKIKLSQKMKTHFKVKGNKSGDFIKCHDWSSSQTLNTTKMCKNKPGSSFIFLQKLNIYGIYDTSPSSLTLIPWCLNPENNPVWTCLFASLPGGHTRHKKTF